MSQTTLCNALLRRAVAGLHRWEMPSQGVRSSAAHEQLRAVLVLWLCYRTGREAVLQCQTPAKLNQPGRREHFH